MGALPRVSIAITITITTGGPARARARGLSLRRGRAPSGKTSRRPCRGTRCPGCSGAAPGARGRGSSEFGVLVSSFSREGETEIDEVFFFSSAMNQHTRKFSRILERFLQNHTSDKSSLL